jgi:hypothetical protein
VVWQADVFKKAKGLQLGSTRELQGGYHFTLYKVTPGEAVKFGPLGYAAAAIQSYGDFKWAPYADRGGYDIHRPPVHSAGLANIRGASQRGSRGNRGGNPRWTLLLVPINVVD